ncbi:MAG: ABC-F family ATP-binding cassette domain-containing protein [Chloroflexota bacterium]
MSLIRVRNVSKTYEQKQVLREVFFRLEEGDRVGLIGKNGTGKTTILKTILGQEEPTSGEVDLNEGLQIGYFSQFSELAGEQSIQEILTETFADIQAMEAELRNIEAIMQTDLPDNQMKQHLARYDKLLQAMEQRHGWTYQNQIDTVLSKLNFQERHRTMPVDNLSGGWRNRAALAKILLESPDVLLLDEPTNFLDFAGLIWLESWLNALSGALIIVSHDRQFLDRVVTRIIEIENYHFHEYEGNFTRYIRQKQTRIKTLERQFQHEAELLAFEAEAITDRQEAAKNPNKALQRRLANIKKQVEPRAVDKIVTDIYQNLRVPNELCRVENIAKAYEDDVLFMDVSFTLQKGDRLAIIGPNGVGKSSLLRLLRGEEDPDDGRVVWPPGIEFADYNRLFDNLDLNDTATHSINIVPLAYHEPRKRVNRFISLFQFSELDMKQRIGNLSGGQRARVALAQSLLSGSPVVILDEPTNHLDLTSTQAMERALHNFPGAVIVVSHDRFFIDKVATRLLIFDDDGEVTLFEGNWTLWQASLEEQKTTS